MKYDVVIEGGGAKGFVLAGAYAAFAALGHTVGRVVGTSAGAIAAVLVAAGYSPEEMLAALEEQENGRSVFGGFLAEPPSFTSGELRDGALRAFLQNVDLKFLPDFIEGPMEDWLVDHLANLPGFRHVASFVERGGWYGADPFVAWLRKRLNTGVNDGQPRLYSDMTLAQFYAATRVEFSAVAANTDGARMLVLNHRTAPDCPVVWAVRMSMSIPLVWQEVIWQAVWGSYRGRDITGNAIVDGGVLSNFALELLISKEPMVTNVMGPSAGNPVIGLLIDDDLPVPPLPSPAAFPSLVSINVKPGELRTVRRFNALLGTMMSARDKAIVEEFAQLVIHLPAKGYGLLEFDMNDNRRAAIVAAGRQAVEEYFAALPPPAAAASGVARAALSHTRGLADRRALKMLAD